MQRTPVSSSNLASVGYDPVTATLAVEFHHGGIYEYDNVSANLHAGLMAAASHGTYFDQHIKKGGFKYRKVG